MITCKEDLIGKYVLTSDKEVVKIFIEACDKFDIRWCDELRASQQYPDAGIYRVHISGCLEYGWTENIVKGYKQLTLEDFIPNEIVPQPPVTNGTPDAHNHTLEENKRSTGAPMPLIVEDGSVCDTRKDIFKEMLVFARENNCFIQFDGFTEDGNGSIIVTFASSDDEFVVKSMDDFREIVKAQCVMDKFLRG